LALMAGGWLLLRHSSLVAVRRVQVNGVHGPEAKAIDAALVAAGRRMSTLDVHVGALRSAVAPFRVVREVHASVSFPHGLRVHVVEQLPVAALTVGSVRTAVAADGVVLGPGLLSASLPTVNGSTVPAAGARLSNPALLAPLAVLGAAPSPLARLVSRVFSGPKGLTLAISNGLLAYFGDQERPHAKWLSLARVLADPSSAGASYVDVRLPERPAAGFPAGVTPPATAGASGASAPLEQAGSSESTVQALAAGLARNSPAAGSSAGEAASASPAGAGSPSSGSESSSSGSRESGEAAPEEHSEAPTESGG
jgi:cell division protein FtsQ